MTPERDPRTRVVLSWLREDAHENAERVLLRALDEVDTTPQRRSSWPARRTSPLPLYAKLAIGAAAVLLVTVVGTRFFPVTSVNPGASATPTISASPTAAPSPTQPPALPSADLAAGTYRLTSYTNRALTLAVPAGWAHVDGNFIQKGDPFTGDGVALATWTLSHIYAHACTWTGTLQPVGSPDSIVAALAAQEGRTASAPTELTLGGEPATRIEMSLDASFDRGTCDQNFVRLWPDPGPREEFGLPIFPGQTSVVHVVDHGDRATIIVMITTEASNPADIAELQGILDSIVFED